MDAQVLKVARAGIGGAAEQDDTFIPVGQERCNAIIAQVRIHSYSITTINIKNSRGIVACCIAKVTALGIDNHRDVSWNGTDDFLEDIHTPGSQHFKKGTIRFESTGVWGCCFYNRMTKSNDGLLYGQ